MTTVFNTKLAIVLEPITCCYSTCGVTFGVDEDHVKNLRRTHTWFYCPNGHQQHFAGESDAERLKRELARMTDTKEWYERRVANLRDDLRVEKISHLSTRGHLGKLRKRIRNGVCPHCQRHFAQLQRHIEVKHPEKADG